MRTGLCLLGVLAGLSGCAARVDVRGVGAGSAPPVYELRGQRLAALDSQARAICPGGYRELRRWQRLQPAEAGSGPVIGARQWVEDTLFPGFEDQAQLVVQCQDASRPVAAARAEPERAPGGASPEPIARAAPAAVESPASGGTVPAVRSLSPLPEAPASAASAAARPERPERKGAATKPAGNASPAARSPFAVPSTGTQGRGSM